MFSQGGFGPVPEAMKRFTKIRASSIADFLEPNGSPAHFESFQILKERETTAAMEMGTIIHMAILEPERFFETYCEEYQPGEGVIKTNDEIKAELKKLDLKVSGNKDDLIERLCAADESWVDRIYDLLAVKHRQGKTELSKKEWRACQRLNERIADDPVLKFVLSDGGSEALGWVFHDESQQVISFRTDYYRKFPKEFMGFHGAVLDVKKFRDIDERGFMNGIGKAKLHIQAAIYIDAINAITGYKNLYGWVGVVDQPPYLVAGYYCDEAAIEAGRLEYEKALLGIAQCYKNNHWPSPHRGFKPASLPAWKWAEIQTDQSEYAT